MRRAARLALAALLAAAPAAAQDAFTGGVHFQGFALDPGLGVDAANLLLVPVGWQARLRRDLSLDLYTAWAHGSVQYSGQVATLTGPVDTRVRASWTATPWAVVTVGLSLPTGNSTHDTEEAVVASVLATDLLGFREANWGVGLGATTGIAAARRVGAWGIGFGASYRYAGAFEPSADTALSYSPGDELRARLAVDREVFGNRASLGVTLQHFARDQVESRDLFRSGRRVRVDASYSFRTGAAATWTAYAADIWRQSGDITLELLDGTGSTVGDTTFATPAQNLIVAGLGGSIQADVPWFGIDWLVPTSAIRPSLDFRLQQRQELAEQQGGEGWALGLGLDVPMRVAGRHDLAPRGRVILGSIESRTGAMHGYWGGELGATFTWRR